MKISGALRLRQEVKYYLKKAKVIKAALDSHPNEWGKYQKDFNDEVNRLFSMIMEFEKNALQERRKEKIEKLEMFFIENFRKEFLKGEYIEWSLRKPFGYSGDFKIIDDIYQNNPTTIGYDRLFDNYYQMSVVSVAVRNRKEDFKRALKEFINENNGKCIRIMNLASGPCREIKELLLENPDWVNYVYFDCYDVEEEAHVYAKNVLKGYKNVSFYLESALRIAAAKDIKKRIHKQYDFIYSMGLFDYLNYKISVRLLDNLKNLLLPNGQLMIADVRDKHKNPSVHFMEWVGDWRLIYRSDNEFRKIFIDAGIKESKLESRYEQQGVMQYVIAKV